MDISVSRLNNRMALQVPAELPLGLVFITGWVENMLPSESTAPGHVEFELVDEQHQLGCRVPQRVIEETQVEVGDRIRVSGHLVFEPRSVHYYLYARDLEVLPDAPPTTNTVTPAVTAATVAKQRAESTSLAQGELPPWVKQLAPRELQEELGFPAEQEEAEEVAKHPERVVDRQNGPIELTPELLDFLSTAIDSDEEIELTRAMIDDYLPAQEQGVGDEEGESDSLTVTESPTPPSIGEAVFQESTPAGQQQEQEEVPQEPALARDALATTETAGKDVRSGNYRKLWVLLFLLLLLFFLMFLLGLALLNIFLAPGGFVLLVAVAV